MNKLKYSVSLREGGLSKAQIKEKMIEKGFEEFEIQYYLKKSDEVFLNQQHKSKWSRAKQKSMNGLKMICLALSLLLLISLFYGYTRIGLIGIFVIWSLIGFSSYRK